MSQINKNILILLIAFVFQLNIVALEINISVDQVINNETHLNQFNNFITGSKENLKFGDILKCEIIKENVYIQNQKSEFKFYTEGSEDYIYFPAPSRNCLTFKIQAEKNAVIMLSDSPSRNYNQLIQFFIGGFLSPSLSLVQRTNNYHIAAQISTPNILNETEFRGFWIKWNSTGFIEIGRQTEQTPFLSYREENQMFSIDFIGFRTWKVSGIWIIEEENCPGISQEQEIDYTIKNLTTSETKCQLISNNTKNSKLETSRILQKNLLNELRTDFQNFNKHYYRSREFLQMCLNELEVIFRKSRELQTDILSSLIDNDQYIKEYLKENVFEEIRTIYFEYYGILQIELNKLSSNEVSSGSDSAKGEEKESTHIDLPFQYYEYSITTEGCIHFRARALRDLYIILSNSPNPIKPFLEIIIGGLMNTKSAIRKNNIDNLVEVATPDILSDNIYRGFWINWKSDGHIKVGHENETEGFLIWKEVNMFPIKFVGIVTAKGVNGQWIVENYKCEPEIDVVDSRYVNRNVPNTWNKHKKPNY